MYVGCLYQEHAIMLISGNVITLEKLLSSLNLGRRSVMKSYSLVLLLVMLCCQATEKALIPLYFHHSKVCSLKAAHFPLSYTHVKNETIFFFAAEYF